MDASAVSQLLLAEVSEEAAQRAAAEGNEWFRQFNEAEVARLDAIETE